MASQFALPRIRSPDWGMSLMTSSARSAAWASKSLASTARAKRSTISRPLGSAMVTSMASLRGGEPRLTTTMADFLRETTDLLRRTPDVLRDLLVGLPETWTETPDVEDGWRPRDVVGHLITGELTDWMARTARILDHGTSQAFDKFDRTAMLERDAGIPLDQLVAQSGA